MAKARKGLRKDKKARAPKNQPICGLWAAARAVGVRLTTAKDVEAFRQECFQRNVFFPKNGNWVGGTTFEERERICRAFGHEVEYFPQFNNLTVNKMLTHKDVYQTRCKWLLTVDKHALLVVSNMTKRKLWVSDQRGRPMRMLTKDKTPDCDLEPILKQRVVSLCKVKILSKE